MQKKNRLIRNELLTIQDNNVIDNVKLEPEHLVFISFSLVKPSVGDTTLSGSSGK